VSNFTLAAEPNGVSEYEKDSQSGPVSRILSPPFRAAAAIYLGRRLPAGSSALPAADPMRAASRFAFRRRSPPIRACWRWGLPCHPPRGGRGALLPHHFTLACEPLAIGHV
jgi:hypothetical protein